MMTAQRMAELSSLRIGMAGYVAMLESIKHEALDTTAIAQAVGVSRLAVLGVMRHCRRAGLVHRPEWFRPAPHSRLVPRWRWGPGPDVSMPQYEERIRRPRRAPSVLLLLTTVLQLLQEEPRTRAEMASELCMHIESVCRVVTALPAAGLIYVASWVKPSRGTTVAEFRLGSQRDARRPAKTANSPATMRQYRQRRAQIGFMQAVAGLR